MRLKVEFPMISSGIEKHQSNFPQRKKTKTPNSDASYLVNPYWKRKTRQFIDESFEVPCRKWYLQISRSRNWMFDTWVGPECDSWTSAQILLRK